MMSTHCSNCRRDLQDVPRMLLPSDALPSCVHVQASAPATTLSVTPPVPGHAGNDAPGDWACGPCYRAIMVPLPSQGRARPGKAAADVEAATTATTDAGKLARAVAA